MGLVSLRPNHLSSAHAPYRSARLAVIWLAMCSSNIHTSFARSQHPSMSHFGEHVANRMRGGSEDGWLTTEPPQQHQQEPDNFRPPEMNLQHMSLALRLTGEFNRRLHAGIKVNDSDSEPFLLLQNRQYASSFAPPINDPLRGGQSSVPTGVFDNPPGADIIGGSNTDNNNNQEPLTLFHAKAPRQSRPGAPIRRGSTRWGPDLLTYLRHVAGLLGLSEKESSLELTMAMIYMDRACSFETPRSNGLPPCPFCTPRTVHRLCLTALLVATSAVRGTDNHSFLEHHFKNGSLQSLGIPLQQLQQMVDWMTGALGDLGFFLTPNQMRDWRHMWESKFPSKKFQTPTYKESQPHLPSQDHRQHYASLGAE